MRNLIYILQKENYNPLRFLRFAYSHLHWHRLEKRQKIVWTIKARLIQMLAWVISLIIIISFFIKFGFIGLFAILGIIILLPVIIVLSFFILSPLDNYVKYRRKNIAKNILAGANLIVVGITGSYGKTSTKEILSKILERKFKVIKTPENINTDIGIADFIIKNKKNITEYNVFVVEMGAYKKGDIKKICNMVRPEYSILTGINNTHLERFGNLNNTIMAKFELPENTNKVSILNFNDENIRNSYERFNIKNICLADNKEIKNIKIKERFGGIEFDINGVKFDTHLLALHNIDLIYMSVKIAQELGMRLRDISEKVEEIDCIPHRLNPIYNNKTNIQILDDSYNGNLNGIKSGLEVLSRATGRKVVLTPGLVETGKKSKDIHYKIGQWYAKNVDIVLLIDNKATRYILEMLNKNNFNNYIIYKNTQDAHADLSNILRSGDTILFQNDLTDNYF